MLTIRPATLEDAPVLTALIRQMAEYDRLGNEVSVLEADIVRDGFGAWPKFRALLAEYSGKLAGYALFFPFYSSFQGRPALFLDDLYVLEPFRKLGVGRALIAHVCKIALREEYFCVRCEMLDWNQPAIDFYTKQDAVFMNEWKSALLIGDALQAIAAKAK
jgi:GNAT superfamily N-acetyltransferase